MQTPAKADLDDFYKLMGFYVQKHIYYLIKCYGFFSKDISQIAENALPCNAEESFKKFQVLIRRRMTWTI